MRYCSYVTYIDAEIPSSIPTAVISCPWKYTPAVLVNTCTYNSRGMSFVFFRIHIFDNFTHTIFLQLPSPIIDTGQSKIGESLDCTSANFKWHWCLRRNFTPLATELHCMLCSPWLNSHEDLTLLGYSDDHLVLEQAKSQHVHWSNSFHPYLRPSAKNKQENKRWKLKYN